MDVDDHEDDNNIGIEVGIGHWGRSWVRLKNFSIGHVDTREWVRIEYNEVLYKLKLRTTMMADGIFSPFL